MNTPQSAPWSIKALFCLFALALFLQLPLLTVYALVPSGSGVTVSSGVTFPLQGYNYVCIKTFTCNNFTVTTTDIIFYFNNGVFTIYQMQLMGYFSAIPIITYNTLPIQQVIFYPTINSPTIFAGIQHNSSSSSFYDIWNSQYQNTTYRGYGSCANFYYYNANTSNQFIIYRSAFVFKNSPIPTGSNIISVIFQFERLGLAAESNSSYMAVVNATTTNGWYQGGLTQVLGSILLSQILPFGQITNITLDISSVNPYNTFTQFDLRMGSDLQRVKPDSNSFDDAVTFANISTNLNTRLVIHYQPPSAITVNSNINGVNVYIDGLIKGVTPLINYPVTNTTHVVSFGDILNWTTPNPIVVNSMFGVLTTVNGRYIFGGSVVPNAAIDIIMLIGTQFLPLMMVVVVPTGLMAYGAKKINMNIGVGAMGGLITGMLFGTLIGLIPLWALFLMMLMAILLGISFYFRGQNSSGGSLNV